MVNARGFLATVGAASKLVQALPADDSFTTTPPSSLSPAAEQIAHDGSLFPGETLQLTPGLLNSIASELHEQLDDHHDALASLFSFVDASSEMKRSDSNCRAYIDNEIWPNGLVWSIFKRLLGKSLLDVAPIASPCYSNWDNYDEDYCSYLASNFTNSHLHMDHPTSVMSPFYQGATCMPIDGEPANCTLGGFPYYVVNATSVAHIQLAINFARTFNMRLVIKNTGHDFAGKSAGAGALSIWTHYLKGISYLSNYNSSTYTGKAFKIGSGVQSYEIYAAADEHDVTVIGGEGETVGFAGGYIAGGGHSPLGSIYGLAADQVLAMEVVTADGKFLSTSEEKNSDLFWALRGGGGSTFGVVTSVTVKAWPKIGATVSSFTFTTSDTGTSEVFWQAMYYFWTHFTTFADAGAYAYFRAYAIGEDEYYFGMTPFFAPNMSKDEHDSLLEPWLLELADLGIELDINATYYDNYYDAWQPSFPLETVGLDAGRIASRLFPRNRWENETLMNETFVVIKNTTENGFYFTGFNMKAELHPDNTENSANPAWRETVLHAITAVAWADGTSTDDIKTLSDSMTYGCMGQWRAVSPGAGSYLGEADSSEPDWQQSFWGTNYDKLLSIKQKYDPYNVFYALHTVGSEGWEVETETGLPTQNGPLCRV
ncbi:uncharacterized protein BCR38DRAFT_371114 [Pseudomassariella vexata]|uniref:FAD-binding PCMH-type domain-containing protein n=1 Tax=Pseudomassariella vexata TaxID=1141098 RepID=A0A1Y2DVL2_9PEZI|nr:uncharacterized protein BCR38DRAFT_371114 [Pseudomassariella vexata]ORY63332.1 hypothetical protein BCR38DRAFT_371114 [Pseudomassariella vexata]